MQINIGETHATISSDGGQTRTAVILERETDEQGRVVSVLLDRRVHHRFWNDREWDAFGAFATVLTRRGYAKPKPRASSGDAPASIDTPGKLALYDALDHHERLTLDVVRAVEVHAPDDWRGNLMRSRNVRQALYDVLHDDDQVEAAFAVIEAHDEF